MTLCDVQVPDPVRPPIAILGVPFDNVTQAEAVERIEEMIASRQPHYLVTPNVDFLVQARRDVELRRILFEAHLVLCDGTPLVWASRWLGNPLPERVAGADLVPLLLGIAARKKYRLFLLGAAPEAARQAVNRLQQRYPDLIIAGHYSPPFNHLLEMNHEEISRRILEAKPDLLFVSFGCPKQEKWVAMHYRQLGVPVTVGVGATIDFLGGHLKRAPVWMQRSGTEWIFRLGQEPRRLFRRYFTDFWVFGSSIVPQWWQLQARPRRSRLATGHRLASGADSEPQPRPWCHSALPERFDYPQAQQLLPLAQEILAQNQDCVLDMNATRFIDSTGVGWLIRLHKRLRSKGQRLILFTPSTAVRRALGLMRLLEFFQIAATDSELRQLLANDPGTSLGAGPLDDSLPWHGEVTAANADHVWVNTLAYLQRPGPGATRTIDLSQVHFIDSSGLGLMIRARKFSQERGQQLRFTGLRPAVLNVLRLACLEDFLLGTQTRTVRRWSGRH